MKIFFKKISFALIISVIIVVLAFALVACDKDSDDFAGTYFFVASGHEPIDFNSDIDMETYLRFFEDGTVEYFSVETFIKGTYELEGSHVSVHFDDQPSLILENGTINGENLLFSFTGEYDGRTITYEMGYKRINMW